MTDKIDLYKIWVCQVILALAAALCIGTYGFVWLGIVLIVYYVLVLVISILTTINFTKTEEIAKIRYIYIVNKR